MKSVRIRLKHAVERIERERKYVRGVNCEIYTYEKRRVKSFIYQSIKKVNEYFERNKNQEVKRKWKLFWKEVGKAKDRNLEGLNNKNAEEQATLNICCLKALEELIMICESQ